MKNCSVVKAFCLIAPITAMGEAIKPDIMIDESCFIDTGFVHDFQDHIPMRGGAILQGTALTAR